MKKIGNTFGKGIKIGMLSAALAMGAVGCKANVDEPGYDYVEETPLETYYFARHRFATENMVNEVVGQNLDKKEKIAWANKHYNEAKDYMLPKVESFLDKVRTENNGDNFLQPICREVFTYYDNSYGNTGFHGSIDEDVVFNNRAYNNVLGVIAAKFVSGVTKQEGTETYNENYENFLAVYNTLALRSYNDSLGNMKNDTAFPFNQERGSIETAVTNNQGSQDYTANPQNLRNVEDTLKKALQLVSANMGVSLQTLTDAVNLCLLNNSLWGARDYLGNQTGLQLTNYVGDVKAPDYTVEKLTMRAYRTHISTTYNQQLPKDLQSQTEAQNENSR